MKEPTRYKMRTRAASALLAAIITIAIPPLAARASGGSGGGGGGGGTGGGGGVVTPPASTGVVSYSNIGPAMPAATGGGWALVGLLAPFTDGTRFFTYQADQFTPTVSGTLSKILLPIHQYATGGNGQFTIRIFSDDDLVPGTLGALLGTYSGQSSQGTNTAVSVVNISRGTSLVAGQAYWIQVVPSAQSRLAWVPSPLEIAGISFYTDPYSAIYYPNLVQGAFEIDVNP